MKLKEKIKKLEKENRLSQKQLAEKLGVTTDIVLKWEKGLLYPDIRHIKKLTEIFNVSIYELLENDVKKEYIKNFFGTLTESQKNSIHFEEYMWHAFSYKLIPSLEGKDAIHEFKNKKVNDVYIIFQYNDIVMERKNLTYESLLTIMEEVECWDCYVVDKNFTWTFVMTHETTIYNNEKNYNSKYLKKGINPFYIGPFFANKLEKV